MSAEASLLEGLPPILDRSIETLILGSFPSPASLAARHYYAHRQNQFWRVMELVVGEPLLTLGYDEKQRCLLRHRYGVWDVYRRCQREGALDSSIQAAEPNDFLKLKTDAPNLQRICFNGKTSAKFANWFAEHGYKVHILPSTSPAYTLAFEQKAAAWKSALLGK